MTGERIQIACDESGSEGENIMGSRDPVFVHASTSVGLDEAQELLDRFRAHTRTPAIEIKSRIALRANYRPALLDLLAAIGDRSNIYLMEKQFYMSAKLVHTLIAEPLAEQGVDFAGRGLGREFATVLHELGPVSIGHDRWVTLLSTFNELIRFHARQGSAPPDPQVFQAALADARSHCKDQHVSEIIEWMWDFGDVSNYGSQETRARFREMDPMFGTLVSVAMVWRMRLGDVPIEFIVDRYDSLDSETIERILVAVTDPFELSAAMMPAGLLTGIRAVDSREDARVQVADILAGCGQFIASQANRGIFDDPVEAATREMLDGNSMWADSSPLNVLYDRDVPRYVQEWIERRDDL